MALNQIRNWLIAYDIASPRRLQRVHRALCEHAVPVQYSVFTARCSSAKIGDIRASLATLIKKREDDVRFYPIPEPAHLFVYGRRALPEGLRLLAGTACLPLAPRLAPPEPDAANELALDDVALSTNLPGQRPSWRSVSHAVAKSCILDTRSFRSRPDEEGITT